MINHPSITLKKQFFDFDTALICFLDEGKSFYFIRVTSVAHVPTPLNFLFRKIIAELAERSPIIIQNSSNPSSRKNLDVRPYDRTRCYF